MPTDRRGATSSVACPLCATPATLVGDEPPWRVTCSSCGLQWVTPPLEPKTSIDYQADCCVFDESGRSAVFDRIERLARARLGDVGRALDVGCGAGAFMSLRDHRGWSVRGIDVNARAVETGRERGLAIELGTLDAVHVEEPFDLVVFMNALEYLAQPLDALQRTHALLRPGGVIVVETPNTVYHSLQTRVGTRLGIRNDRLMFVEAQPGRRLMAFGPKSARLALSAAGFVDIAVLPSLPRRAGALHERVMRRAIYAAAAVFASNGRLLTPSMLVAGTRAP